jgi:hypothetical protein|tara:strand:- start:419 stop:565 length:147 start_codon:yes stop_codon:yes gene_type:complete
VEIPEAMKNAAVIAADIAMDKYSIEKVPSSVNSIAFASFTQRRVGCSY